MIYIAPPMFARLLLKVLSLMVVFFAFSIDIAPPIPSYSFALFDSNTLLEMTVFALLYRHIAPPLYAPRLFLNRLFVAVRLPSL